MDITDSHTQNNKIEHKIKAINLLYEYIEKNNSKNVLMGGYIKDIVKNTILTFSHDFKINLEIIVTPNMKLESELAKVLGQITIELVVNSIKHAFPKKKSKTHTPLINIHLLQTFHELSLKVSDNGLGISNNISKSKGEGLKIIEEYAKVYKGKFEIKNNGQGTTSIFEIKVY